VTQHKKILLVEDDEVFANVYRNKLLLEGFKVEIATDGEAGLKMARDFRPDAVLMDLMLPKLAGVEVIKRLRLEPHFKTLPILVFTNTYLTSAVQEAWKAGATKCLTKADCTPKQIVGTLRTILNANDASKTPEATPGIPAPPPADSAPSLQQASPDTSDDSNDPDQEFQAELRKSFVVQVPASLNALRVLLQGLIKADNDAARLQQLKQLSNQVRLMTSNAGIVGMWQLAQMSDALEALLRELQEKPRNINASTLRTVASAIDFLGTLFERTGADPGKRTGEASVLVVDDDPISLRALVYSLEKAKLKSVSVGDSLQAFQMLSQSTFDLILLDVDMPNMNGFELCSKLRTLPAYKKTPVVFVTSLNDFENRANSSMSGGNDFIGKPFLFIELAVKALVHVLRGQLHPAKG
jgi:DNA-binding response OmpR family regulator